VAELVEGTSLLTRQGFTPFMSSNLIVSAKSRAHSATRFCAVHFRERTRNYEYASAKEMKNKEDLINSFELLNFYLKEFESGKTIMYLPMAVELRKLLCEKNPSPLLERTIPEFKLYKLHFTGIIDKSPSLLNGLEHSMPGSLSTLENGTLVFNLGFAHSREQMTITDWISQPFFKESVTIYELIKSVADKEAAHADVKYNDTLTYCKSWSYGNIDTHVLGIYGISKFLHSLYTIEYKQAFEKNL
jgi:hypothetical protein